MIDLSTLILFFLMVLIFKTGEEVGRLKSIRSLDKEKKDECS